MLNPDASTSQAAGGGSDAPVPGAPPRRAPWKLLLLIAVCVAPVIASYLAYFVFPPLARTNYGQLVQPQRPVPGTLTSAAPDSGLGRFRGRWMLMTIGDQGCDEACARRLYFVRQTHAAMGRERERVQQVLLMTDGSALRAELRAVHPELAVVHADRAVLIEWLQPQAGAAAVPDWLYLVDPLQNHMMRFPPDPDPAGVRKDLQKLLKASRIG